MAWNCQNQTFLCCDDLSLCRQFSLSRPEHADTAAADTEQNKNDENLIFLVVSVSKVSEMASIIHPTHRSFVELNHFLRRRALACDDNINYWVMQCGWAGRGICLSSLGWHRTFQHSIVYCLQALMSFCGWWAGTETSKCSASVQCFTCCSKQIKTGGSFWKPGNHYLGLKSQPFMAIGIYPTLDIISEPLVLLSM